MGIDRGRDGSFWAGPLAGMDVSSGAGMLAAGLETAPDATVPSWIRGFLVYCHDADTGDVCQSERLSGLYFAGLSVDAGGNSLPASRAPGASPGARACGRSGESRRVARLR